MNLKNARVLLVGGTSGIGLGVATAVAERGGVPIVASRNQASVDRALGTLPDGARGLTVDLTDPAALAGFAAQVGPIEHLVFTAGEELQMYPLADITAEAIGDLFGTRFAGQLLSVRAFAPRITAGGSITLTSGTAADKPDLGVLPAAVCGAVSAMTRALAVELAPLRVNAVAPGPIDTPLWSALAPRGTRCALCAVRTTASGGPDGRGDRHCAGLHLSHGAGVRHRAGADSRRWRHPGVNPAVLTQGAATRGV